MFVSTAHNSLKKNKQLEGDAWKLELNIQIAQFIRILQECLRVVNHIPPELTAKVDGYAQRLAPPSELQPHEHGTATPPPTNGAGPSGAIMFSSVSEMSLVRTVSRLFGYTDQEVQSDLASLRKTCTPKVRLVVVKEPRADIFVSLFPQGGFGRFEGARLCGDTEVRVLSLRL